MAQIVSEEAGGSTAGLLPDIPTQIHSAGSNGKASTLQVVEFLLGKEHFAIDLFDVKEVVEYTNITKLPNASSYMKGIIDLRGEITTIIDLKERLAIQDKSDKTEEESRIIVLDEKITKSKIGIMVDDVLSVSTFDINEVESASTSGLGEDSSILGIIKKKNKDREKEVNELIIWIDIKGLLKGIDEHA